MLATSPSNIFCTRLFVFPIQLLVRVARKGKHSWLDLFGGLHFWKFCQFRKAFSQNTDILAKKEYCMYPSFRSRVGQINVDTFWQQFFFFLQFLPLLSNSTFSKLYPFLHKKNPCFSSLPNNFFFSPHTDLIKKWKWKW